MYHGELFYYTIQYNTILIDTHLSIQCHIRLLIISPLIIFLGIPSGSIGDMLGRVLSGSKHGVRQTRGKFGLGAKMVS